MFLFESCNLCYTMLEVENDLFVKSFIKIGWLGTRIDFLQSRHNLTILEVILKESIGL